MLPRFLSIVFIFLSLHLNAQSYLKLHQKALVVDAHNDILISILEGLNIENDLSGKTHSDLQRFKRGGVDVQIFSIWSDERYEKGGFNYANRQIDSVYAIAGRASDKMMIVRNTRDLKKAVKEKKLGAMMGMEGGHMIEDNLVYLDSLYKRGVRYMTLTWNNSTSWASSAKDEEAPSKSHPLGETLPLHKGLNELGKQVVRRMNELGMLVDLSHVGEQTFWDVISIATKPVIVSHSCVYALCPHRRNLKDDQVKALAKNGGVIHLNFYSGFLDSGYAKRKESFTAMHTAEIDSLKKLKLQEFEIDFYLAKKYPSEVQYLRPPLSLLIDHIDHIVKLAGINHVGLGSDFDGIESAPQGLDDVASMPNITKALLERGYSKKDVRKILGENFLRLLKANEKQ